MQQFTKNLARNGLHNSISAICIWLLPLIRIAATFSQPSAASLIFSNVSSNVSPSETQPAKTGISAQNPPSSS
jgi:beta-lactamase regulating signal transducer with metallopeptidase domain